MTGRSSLVVALAVFVSGCAASPEGQSAGAPPYWNYQYGTDIRVYGLAN